MCLWIQKLGPSFGKATPKLEKESLPAIFIGYAEESKWSRLSDAETLKLISSQYVVSDATAKITQFKLQTGNHLSAPKDCENLVQSTGHFLEEECLFTECPEQTTQEHAISEPPFDSEPLFDFWSATPSR